MLYVFTDGSNSRRYVGGERDRIKNEPQRHAYKYVDSLSDARLFDSVSTAISWLEKAAYNNGKQHHFYSGYLYLMKIEIVPIAYKEIGLLE